MLGVSMTQLKDAEKHASVEQARLAALDDLGMFGTAPEEEFDDLVSLASQLCQTPISLISLVGADHLWFKACWGMELESLPRNEGFCAHAIEQDDLFEIGDARRDARFAHLSFVDGDANIRFYAGMPLCGGGGHRYGTLCVLDTAPRELTVRQRDGLRRLARRATASLELAKKQLIAHNHRVAVGELLEMLPDAVITCDESGVLKEFNAVAREWYGEGIGGYKPDEWAARFGLYNAKGLELLRIDQLPLVQALKGYKVRDQTIVIQSLNHPPRTVNCNANPLLDDVGMVRGAICSMHDVTVEVRFAKMMEKMALTDELTGLPNRAAWFAELDRVVARAERNHSTVVILFIDLNGFKKINDTLGHSAGDEVLNQFSGRLTESCRKCDFIARLAGDEFVILLNPNADGEVDPYKVVERIHEAMKKPFELEQQTVIVGCSVGVAIHEGPEFDAARLMENADKAMYEAKRARSASYR
jgi:diguanylate cyclase (GGDEF)-like protein